MRKALDALGVDVAVLKREVKEKLVRSFVLLYQMKLKMVFESDTGESEYRHRFV